MTTVRRPVISAVFSVSSDSSVSSVSTVSAVSRWKTFTPWFILSGLLCLFPLFLFTGSVPDEAEGAENERALMVRVLKRYGIKDPRVLAAMGKVRRHMYIPEKYRDACNPYGDHPCPIGEGQTISQPYIVAYMTERLALTHGEKVLEIGTGSGYQAAVLAQLGVKVYTIEIVESLAEHAAAALKAEGYPDVRCRYGDGYQGWPEHAPFNAVIVTCAPEKVPEKLIEQLKEGGRMIVPLGTYSQRLVILRKKEGKIYKENDLGVQFVPMVHK